MARILIDSDSIEDGTAVVRGPEARHLLKVLRLKEGAQVTAFDAAGTEWPATVRSVSATRATLELGPSRQPRRESPLEITVAIGLPKGDTLDRVVRSLTELGVRRIVPLHSERAVPDALTEHKLKRLRRIAREACKQCGRNEPPTIETSRAFEDFLAACREAPASVQWIFWEEDAQEAAPASVDEAASACVIVGPEGGLTKSEVDAARAAGFTIMSLGPRVLRVHTAAVAAVTRLGVAHGDMG